MSLSIAIMAHPKRKAAVDALFQKLEHQGAPDVPVSWDDDNNVWSTAKRAWALFKEDATHHLVLQDDITFCDDFLCTADLCASLRPQNPISFYLPRPVVDRAAEARIHWVSTRKFQYAQAVLMPVSMVRTFLIWSETLVQPRLFDDERQHMFFHTIKCRAYTPVPLLVDHLGVEQSLLGHKHPRTSKYIGDAAHAFHLPWNDLREISE